MVILGLSHIITTAETDNNPAGSQYSNLALVDTTELAEPGEQLVSHRDIRVMFSGLALPSIYLLFHFPVHHLGNFGLLGRCLPPGPTLPTDGAGQEALQT